MLTRSERERYRRHIMLPEVGESGQERLLGSRVLVAGAGGLGSPAALYLAAAGVGVIGIADSDHVDLSNLQRQILHDTASVGSLKVDSAKKRLASLNPDCRTELFPVRLEKENIEAVISRFDVVLDATDSLFSKFLLNDTAVRLGIPLVHAGILAFVGQVTTIIPGKGPCYRCLFTEMPEGDEDRKECENGGVFGVLPGIIGSVQAAEAIKILLGIGQLLTGRLLVFDLLKMRFRDVDFVKNPQCAACG